MKKEKLSHEEGRLYYQHFHLNTIENCQNYLQLISDMYFEVITETQMAQQKSESIQNYFAKTTMQMFFTKALATINLLNGVSYIGRNYTLPPIQDHSLLFVMTRNFCETIAAYNVLFLLPDTDDKRRIMENLFLYSGYKYQLRLFSESMQTEFVTEHDIVNQNIQNMKSNIKNTIYYKSLSSEQRDKIKSAIRTKNYKLMLSDNEVQILSWQECLNSFVNSKSPLDRIYTYLSLHAHPSIIGMEQFGEAFGNDNKGNEGLCVTACECILSFMSMFLQEYMKLFPKAQEVFDRKTDFEKWLLTMYDYRKNK